MGHKVKQSLMSSRIDFFYYAFRNVLLVSIPLLVVSGVVLSHLSFHSSATDSSSDSTSSTDSLSFSISSSCTLSSVVDSSHTAELINGTYTNGIGKTTITTLCNDGNGYSVYAVGYSNNEEGNNKLVNTESSNFNIVSGTAESGNTSNWAMSLNNLKDDPSLTPPVITSDYDGIYGIVPDKWTKVASLPAKATDMIKGSSFTTTYAVYTSSSQYAGTYNGQVKYMLVHPNTNKPTLNNLESAFASHGIQPIYRDEDNKYYFAMQDMTADICSSVSGDGENTATQLVDTRDDKLYWVTKLKDGHCWMTSNLDLDISGTNVATLTSENTDISTTASGSGIYSAGYTEQDGVWTWTPVSTAITSNYYIYGNSVKPSAWPTNNYITPYSAEGGDTYYYTSNNTNNDTRYNSLQDCKNASHTEDECKRYFVGNYYNWSAAIASNNSTNISTTGAIASNSICPKGWRLPNASQTDNVNNEFGRMLYQAEITAKVSAGDDSVGYTTGGFNKLRSNPYYFVRSGDIGGGLLDSPGVYGFYWSSTVSSSTSAYSLAFGGNNEIYPARGYGNYGWSVRCVARSAGE